MKSKVLSILFFLFVAVCLRAEELSGPEAQAILRLATKHEKLVGSFITESKVATRRGTHSVTILAKYYPDGTSCFRKVKVETPTRTSRPTKTQITVKNAAGVWSLTADQAILMPALFSQETMQQAIEAVRTAKEAGKEPVLEEVFAGDPLLLRCAQIGRHMHWSGERLVVDTRPCLRVVELMDKEGQKLLQTLVKEQMAEVKKSLPFMVRVIATPMLAAMDLTAELPMRTEHLIDRETGVLISTKRFNAKGVLLPEPEAPVRKPIAEIPDETFTVPTGLTVVRPKTLGEFLSLRMKASKGEEAKGGKKAKDQPVNEVEEGAL